MGKMFSIFMYILWTLTIISVLVTTFTNFQYEDFNLIAGLLLAFSLLNTYFAVNKGKQNTN